MPDPIRLLHFADLHVGMENYGKLDPQTGISSRIRDFLDRLDEIVDFALAHGTTSCARAVGRKSGRPTTPLQ